MYKEIAESFGSISRRTNSIFRKRCKDAFISRGLVDYLIIIYENKGIIAEDIANILRVDKGTTARAIAKLEQEKYIVRVKDEEDKRKYKLYITEKSEKLCQELLSNYYEIGKEAVEILSKEEKEELLRILGKIRNHIRWIDTKEEL